MILRKLIRLVIVTVVMLLMLTFISCNRLRDTGTTGNAKKPIHQLRIYEIFEANKTAFHERFKDHAKRIMLSYDFRIIAIWETHHNNTTEFVYLLEWPDEQTMKDKWSQFMADEEWADIKKKTGAIHGDLVGNISDRTLILTDYSPSTNLLRE